MWRRPLAWAAAVGATPLLCRAHGRLGLPVPRVGTDAYENDPVPSQTDDDFVCRHLQPNPNIQPPRVVAGQTLDMRWDLSAAHVGDCAVFITYDVEKPRKAQKYVKIANLPDCKSQNEQVVKVDVPSVLPAGKAILRWDWKALHVFPKIEWYVQCADIIIESTSVANVKDLNGFSIIEPPIYPAHGHDGVGFRDPWSDGSTAGQPGFYVTGPACVDATLNQCALTSPGERGFTGAPVEPECRTVTVSDGDTPASIVARAGGAATWEEVCAMNGLGDCSTLPVGDRLTIPPCEDYPVPRRPGGAPLPAPAPAPEPAPAPAPAPAAPPELAPPAPAAPAPAAPPTPLPAAEAPAPAPAGEGQCCYHGGCASFGTAMCNAAGAWCSETSDQCSRCGGTFCTAASAPSAPAPAPSPAPATTTVPWEPVPAAPAPAAPPAPAPPATAAPAPNVPAPTGPPVPAAPAAAGPTPPPAAETPAPALAGQGECCYHGGCASFGTTMCNAAGSWCSETSDRCSRCGGTYCTAASAPSSEEEALGLSEAATRLAPATRHRFLGAALIQAGAELGRAGPAPQEEL